MLDEQSPTCCSLPIDSMGRSHRAINSDPVSAKRDLRGCRIFGPILEVNSYGDSQRQNWKAGGVWSEMGHQCLPRWVRATYGNQQSEDVRPRVCLGVAQSPSRGIRPYSPLLCHGSGYVGPAQPGTLPKCGHRTHRHSTQRKSSATGGATGPPKAFQSSSLESKPGLLT